MIKIPMARSTGFLTRPARRIADNVNDNIRVYEYCGSQNRKCFYFWNHDSQDGNSDGKFGNCDGGKHEESVTRRLRQRP